MEIETALQEALNESIKRSGAIGVSAAVIFADGRMWTGAAGISHEGVPVTPEMLFDIGSIEKHFQAALALKLVEEGWFGLEDPLEKWLPAYPNIDGKITVRQLLGMTSGIDTFVGDPNSPFLIGYLNIDHEKIWTWEDILSDFIAEPNFKSGTKCEYATTNYMVLKQIIEKAVQSKQIDLLKDRLLEPYRLDHTLVDFFEPVPEHLSIVHGWCDINVDGEADDLSKYALDWIASLSPMLVYSTPSDMVQWTDALFNKKSVLSAEMLGEMLKFTGPVQNEPMMNGYGLGIVDLNLGILFPRWGNVKVYGHLGSQFGYSTLVGYFPDLEISISIMFNRGCDRDTNPAIAAVAGAFFDVIFSRLGVEPIKGQDSVADMRKALKQSPDDVHLMVRIAKKLQENNDDHEASLMYEDILKKDPENRFGYRTEARFWKASYDGVIHKKPEGLIAFISEHPDYQDIGDAYRWLARTHVRRDEVEKAVQVYHAALQRFEDDEEFYNHYAWWVYENKIESEYERAIQYTKEALSLRPEAYYIWDTLAWLYYENREYRQAQEASEKALSLAPENQGKEYEETLNRMKKLIGRD